MWESEHFADLHSDVVGRWTEAASPLSVSRLSDNSAGGAGQMVPQARPYVPETVGVDTLRRLQRETEL